jgi:tetraacyldisaccharide 4'-kinase
MKAPLFWYKPRSVMGELLSPLSVFYRVGGKMRRALARPYKAKIPVICVGNVTAGGAGKTPVALALAALLKAQGQKPVFVTRGYGGREHGPLRVDLATHKMADVGDEALLLARIAPTWIGRNRAAAIRAAEPNATHIVLDDGLQNPNVIPAVSLLVIDGTEGFGNNRVIPAGPLREPLDDALRRVTAAVVIGEDQYELALRLRCPILRARMTLVIPENFPRGDKFLAFAGIGRPKKFFDSCRAASLKLVKTVPFADHHVFTGFELDALKKDAAAQGARLLTTEKDYVRLPENFRRDVLAIPVVLNFDQPEEIIKLLQSSIAAPR